MEFFGKDKLSRLDEERQRRRQQRADEAIRRLEDVGKQTLEQTQQASRPAHVSTEQPDAQEANRGPGKLSRVLFETATTGDPRRARGKRQGISNPANLLQQGQTALRGVDQAMATVRNAMSGAMGAGLAGGLEQAGQQVTNVVQQMSSMAGNAFGSGGPNAGQQNPLAELMQQERDEEQESQPAQHEEQHDRGPGQRQGAGEGNQAFGLEHAMGAVANFGRGGFENAVGAASNLMPNELSHTMQQATGGASELMQHGLGGLGRAGDMMNQLGGAATDMMGQLPGAASQLAGGAAGILGGGATEMLGQVSGAATAAMGGGALGQFGVMQGAMGAAQAMMSQLAGGTMGAGAPGLLGQLGGAAGAAMGGGAAGILGQIGGAAGGATEMLGQISGAATAAMGGGALGQFGAMQGAMGAAQDMMSQLTGSLPGGGAAGVLGQITGAAGQVGNALANPLGALTGTAGDAVGALGQFGNALANPLGALTGGAAGPVGQLTNALVNPLGALTAATGGAGGVLGQLSNAITNPLGALTGVLQGVQGPTTNAQSAGAAGAAAGTAAGANTQAGGAAQGAAAAGAGGAAAGGAAAAAGANTSAGGAAQGAAAAGTGGAAAGGAHAGAGAAHAAATNTAGGAAAGAGATGGSHASAGAGAGAAHDGAAGGAAAGGAAERAARSTSTAAQTAPRPPVPGSGTPAQSHAPAAQRQAAVAPTNPQGNRNASPVAVAGGGQLSVSPQPVASSPSQQVSASDPFITQPNVSLEARSQSAPLPGMPTDLGTQAAPTAGSTQPPAAANAPTANSAPQGPQRQVAPLANVPSPGVQAENPAIAAGRTAASNISLPHGQGTPLPGGSAPAAAGATPAPGPARPPGATALPTTAATPQPPPATRLPPVAMTPSAAAPQTPSQQAPEPNIPAVRNPGGSGVPSPSSLVQPTANLSADRSNASSQLSAEARTQSRVGPEAAAQRASQIAPLRGEMQTTARSQDAPRAQAVSSSQQQGSTAATQGRARDQQAAATGRQQITGQATSAAGERQQFKAMPPPAILQQTSTAAMQAATAPARAAVANVASAARAVSVAINPAANARAAAAGAMSSTLPQFDPARFNEVDNIPPTPELQTEAMTAGQQAADQTYAAATAQIDGLSNIPAPQINASPSGNPGEKTPGGYPTREAAIATIETQLAQRAQADGPAQMQQAAGTLQGEARTNMTSAQQGAQTSANAQFAAQQAQATQIRAQQPPTTGAQVAAETQPQYQAHQADATAASTQMRGEISGAQTTANSSAQAARGQRDQAITQAQGDYQSTVSGQLMPQYTQAQQAAKQQFDQQNTTAQQQHTTEQTNAQTQATTQTESARARADADITSESSALQSQQTQANASHQQQMSAASQQHDTQMTAAQTQADADVQNKQSDMASQVSREQQQGQQEVDQHLQEGEQGYQREVQAGTQQAEAERQRAEAEAKAKEAEAQKKKDENSGGILGKIGGAISGAINGLLDLAKSILSAARDMIVGIMEKARAAAIAVLNKARQAALAVLSKVKSAIQGVISAAASAIRSIISAAASLVRNLIQALANVLKNLVSALTTMLTNLVKAFQFAVNALLDGLIAAVSLINKDLGDKLRSATQKYRDAFNGAMNKLQTGIQAAGDALKSKIQQVADHAITIVNAAERTLNDAVSRVEQVLNQAVEIAYQVGAAAINRAFDLAEAVVNRAFDVAVAAVKAYFDAQIGALNLVQTAFNKVAEFVGEVANQVLATISKIAEGIINMIPESWTKAFVDFWNGPWRSIIIIGLAVIASVAFTVVTGGLGGPIAAVFLAGLVGGTITGAAYLGGEALAREGAIQLTEEGNGVYVPGFGSVKVDAQGNPIPPANMTPEQQADWEKQSKWAMSNFNLQRDQAGNVTGVGRKSNAEIGSAAMDEGIKGFGEGFIASAGAATGGALAGAGWVGRIATNPVARTLLKGVIEAGVEVTSTALGSAWNAGFTAIQEGGNPVDALKAALKAGGTEMINPQNWIAAAVTMGVAPGKANILGRLDNQLVARGSSAVTKAVISKGTEAAIDTATEAVSTVGGAFVIEYTKQIAAGKSPGDALAAAKKAGADAFDPTQIMISAGLNVVGGAVSTKAEKRAASAAAIHGNTPDAPNTPRGDNDGPARNRERSAEERTLDTSHTADPTPDHTPARVAPRTTNDPAPQNAPEVRPRRTATEDAPPTQSTSADAVLKPVNQDHDTTVVKPKVDDSQPKPKDPAAPEVKPQGDPLPVTASPAERRQRLVDDKGTLTSEAYSAVPFPKDVGAQWKLMENPANWTPERQKVHREILDHAVGDARKFADAMAKADPGGDPTLYAMRGNTGAGKTRTISGGDSDPVLASAAAATKNDRHRAVNPDNFKLDIYDRDKGASLTSSQVHMESSILANRFHRELLDVKATDGRVGSVLIDKRLGALKEVQGLQKDAASSGRKFGMIDVDAPLTDSLAGVLGDRTPGGKDPIPPFGIISGGFQDARANRRQVIDSILSDGNAGYKLFATNPDGSKVLVAEVHPLKDGEVMPQNPKDRLVVHDQRKLQEMIPSERKAKVEAAEIARQKVTEESILAATKDKGEYGAQLAEKLRPHIGKTWEQAVNDWSKAAPGTTADGMRTPQTRGASELGTIKNTLEETKTPRVMKPISEWERTLSAIDRIDAKGQEGLRTTRKPGSGDVDKVGSQGHALELARQARAEILKAKRVIKRIDAGEGKYKNLTPAQADHLKQTLAARVERKARKAVEAATGMSGDAASQSQPNDIRSELLQKHVPGTNDTAAQQEANPTRREEVHLGDDMPARPPNPREAGLRSDLDSLQDLRGQLRKAPPDAQDRLKSEIAAKQADLDAKLSDPASREALLDPRVVFALARENSSGAGSNALKQFLSTNIEGVTRAQAQGRQGVDPELRAKREIFEREIALTVLRDGPVKAKVDANLELMSKKALDYITKSGGGDQALAALGMPASSGYAGAVLTGTDPAQHAATMRDVLLNGNARERMIALGKFAELVAGDMLKNPAKFDQVANAASGAAGEFGAKDVDAYRKRMEEYKKDKKYTGAEGQAVPDTKDFLKPTNAEKSGSQKDYQTAKNQDMDTKLPGVFESDAEAFLGRGLAPGEKDAKNPGTTGQGESSPLARTSITVKEAQAMGYHLSAREIAAAGGPDGKLPWIVGTVANVVDPSAQFIATATQASLPQKAGVSGTTFRFMEAASLLGGDANMSRLAMIGALETIDAHTVYEIANAAKGFGLAFDPTKPYADIGLPQDVLQRIAASTGTTLEVLNGQTQPANATGGSAAAATPAPVVPPGT